MDLKIHFLIFNFIVLKYLKNLRISICLIKFNDLRCYKPFENRLKSCHSLGHNILELLNFLAKFSFTASKVVLDI